MFPKLRFSILSFRNILKTISNITVNSTTSTAWKISFLPPTVYFPVSFTLLRRSRSRNEWSDYHQLEKTKGWSGVFFSVWKCTKRQKSITNHFLCCQHFHSCINCVICFLTQIRKKWFKNERELLKLSLMSHSVKLSLCVEFVNKRP